MDNIIEIKGSLDALYKEYKDNKFRLSDEKTESAANLMVKMTFSNNVNPSDVVAELSRFPADVVRAYFELLTKSATVPLVVLDKILKEWPMPKLRSKQNKYIYAVTAIMKNYKDKALQSTQLPYLVAFAAQSAMKSDKCMSTFQTLINNTTAEIFMLDYSNISKNSLTNVWNATKALYPDLSKAKYESFITDWAIKYNFLPAPLAKDHTSAEIKVKNEESVVAEENQKEETPVAVEPPSETESISTVLKDEEADTLLPNTDIKETKEESISVPESVKDDTSEDNVTSTDKKASNSDDAEATSKEKAPSKKSSVQILYDRLKRDMDKEQETIIAAYTDRFAPIGKALESIQGEISISRELGFENATLKAENAELERRIAEMRMQLQESSQSLASIHIENSDLRKQISALEARNAELDGKLNDAYAINSRESSLEAEKVRSELKKAFSFLYEDWLEYEFSDVSVENYESLQAIIKKVFRSLERNGIDFKGNN